MINILALQYLCVYGLIHIHSRLSSLLYQSAWSTSYKIHCYIDNFQGHKVIICDWLFRRLGLLRKYGFKSLIDFSEQYSNEGEEEFEDTKGVIRICKLKDRQHNGQKKRTKKRSTKHYTSEI